MPLILGAGTGGNRIIINLQRQGRHDEDNLFTSVSICSAQPTVSFAEKPVTTIAAIVSAAGDQYILDGIGERARKRMRGSIGTWAAERCQ